MTKQILPVVWKIIKRVDYLKISRLWDQLQTRQIEATRIGCSQHNLIKSNKNPRCCQTHTIFSYSSYSIIGKTNKFGALTEENGTCRSCRRGRCNSAYCADRRCCKGCWRGSRPCRYRLCRSSSRHCGTCCWLWLCGECCRSRGTLWNAQSLTHTLSKMLNVVGVAVLSETDTQA